MNNRPRVQLSPLAATVKQILLASALAAGSFNSVAVMGQEAPSQATSPTSATETASAPQEIVVTGTRISRPDLTQSSPVNVVNPAELTERQPATGEDLLHDLPSVRPANGPGVDNGSDGSSTVDLRGLGPNRTLVLLDGHRIVPYGLNAVTDLNDIPTALVERVDVVTGGASSVYGADAVAGVVNFITKRNFSGVEITGNYRITERGDSQQYRLDGLFGGDFADGKGNAVVGLGYLKRDPLLAQDRAIGVDPLSSVNGQFEGSQNTVPILFTSPTLSALGLPPGSLGAVLNPSTGALRTATQSDTYNSNQLTYYQTPLQRESVYTSAHYEVNPSTELWGTAMFNSNHAVTSIAPSGTFQNSYNLPLSNAYLPTGVRNQFCNALGLSTAQCQAAAVATPGSPNYTELPILGQRRFVEFGPRVNDIQVDQFQLEAGVRGDLGVSNLHYDIEGQYGETSDFDLYQGWGSNSKLQQSILSYRNSSGAPVCNDPSNGCVPINLFGPAGSITPAMVNFVDSNAQVRYRVTLTDVTADIGGDLFGVTSPLASKPIAFSLGTEYRQFVAVTQPDANLEIQNEVLGTGAPITPDRGSIQAKEVFGETIAPVVEDKPLIRHLQIEAGLRYSDYDTTGGSTTWKAGGNWEPFEGYKIRAMYQVAVRSPNITELFQETSTGLSALSTDPCQGNVPVGNKALTALCIATGAPRNTIGSIPAPSAGQINTTSGGNPNVDVEEAHTYTVGLVVTPPEIRRLSLTFDFFHIVLDDAISTPSVGDIIDGCFSTTYNPTLTYNQFCRLVGRNPLTGGLNGTGNTLGAALLETNQGLLETAGLDMGADYSFDLTDLGLSGNPGTFQASFTGTWLDYYHFQASPLSINRDCSGYYSTNCGGPRPTWKWNTRLTWTKAFGDVSLLWTHIGAVHIEPYQPVEILPLTTPQYGGPNPANVFPLFQHVPAYDYFDLSGSWHVNKTLTLRLLISNLFDKQPPLSYSVGVNPAVDYDVLGRAFNFTADLKF